MAETTSKELTGKQRRHLRALAHHLSPLVQIGKEGVTSATILATKQALLDHELIKIKVLEGSPLKRSEAALAIAEPLKAHVAGEVGRIIILYRAHPKEPQIKLPSGK